MDRAQKAQEVSSLNGVFAKAGLVVVAHYSGLTVSDMNKLRARLREQGGRFRVAKNRLAQRALEGTSAGGIAPLFKGPTGIAYSDDPIGAAKAAHAYAKENEKFVILGGVMGDTVLDANAVKALAELPSLDELRGKIVGLLVAPATKIAAVVQAPASKLARVLNAYAQKSDAA